MLYLANLMSCHRKEKLFSRNGQKNMYEKKSDFEKVVSRRF